MSAYLLSIAALLTAMGSIQLGSSLAKALFHTTGAGGAVALRLTFSAAILLLIMRPWRIRPSPAAWPPLLIYGAALGGMNLCIYLALRTVPVGLAVAVELLGPLGLALWSSRRAVDFLSIGLAGAGVFGLAARGPAAVDPVGLAYALGAGAFWAVYIVFGKRAGTAYGLRAVAIGSLVAAVLIAPFCFAASHLSAFQPRAIGLGLLVAVLSTAIPYVMELRAMGNLPTKVYGGLASLEPLLGTLFGFVVLRERVTVLQSACIAAVVLAATVMATSSAPRPQAP